MRSFIRHPANMPIEFNANTGKGKERRTIQNVSTGGLCFISDTEVEAKVKIKISIPNLRSEFTEDCIVTWCRKLGKKYEIGVKFLDDQTAFRMRMVEQICYIENYRKEVLANEGRKLSSKEASGEWIKKYAKDFPKV